MPLGELAAVGAGGGVEILSKYCNVQFQQMIISKLVLTVLTRYDVTDIREKEENVRYNFVTIPL